MNSEKKLLRSSKDRVILGVCGGLADYFEVDPVIVRVIFILLAFGSGFGVILYIVLAIAIPSDSDSSDGESKERIKKVADDVKEKINSVASEIKSDSSNTEKVRNLKNLAGIILIVIGIIVLANQFFNIHWIEQALLPLMIVLLGFYLVFKK